MLAGLYVESTSAMDTIGSGNVLFLMAGDGDEIGRTSSVLAAVITTLRGKNVEIRVVNQRDSASKTEPNPYQLI
jgi:hypothetical protein